jgi:plastocyanin
MKFTTALLLSAYTASTVLATNHMAYVMPAQMPSEQLSSGSGSMADTMPNEGMVPVSPLPTEIPANMPAAELPAAQMPAAPIVETTAVMMHTAATTMMHQGQKTTIAAPMQHQVTAMPTHVMMPAASAGVGGEAATGGAVGGAAGMTHTVIVGGAGLAFNPTEVTAAIGDKVKFIMMAKNHTVTQSTFAKPCVKLATGMDSGFLPNSGNDTATAPTFEVTVDTTDATCREPLSLFISVDGC